MEINPIIQDFTTPTLLSAYKPNTLRTALWSQRTVLVLDEVERFLVDFDRRYEGKFKLYAPIWQEYKKDFRQNIVEAQKVPLEIISALKDFHQTLLPLATVLKEEGDAKESTESFIKELDQHIERAKALSKEAKSWADKFFVTERSVNRFKKEFDRTVEDELENRRILSPGVIYGLEHFIDAWNSVFTDLESIHRYLENFKQRAAALPMMTRFYLKNANTIYISVANAVRGYHSAMQESLEAVGLVAPPDPIDPLIDMILAAGAEVDGDDVDQKAAAELAQQLFGAVLAGEA